MSVHQRQPQQDVRACHLRAIRESAERSEGHQHRDAARLHLQHSTLGQETAALDNPPLMLVVVQIDRARIHNEEKILEAFSVQGEGWTCHVHPEDACPRGKAHVSAPLDNALFHDWKEAIRKHGPLTLNRIRQVMSDEWNNITSRRTRSRPTTSTVGSLATLMCTRIVLLTLDTSTPRGGTDATGGKCTYSYLLCSSARTRAAQS